MTTHAELCALIARHTPQEGFFPTALPRLGISRSSAPTEPLPGLCEPALCVVAQGSKQAMVGGQRYIYDANTYLVVSVDLPCVGNVIEATADRPYLGMKIELNLPVLAELMLERDVDPRSGASTPPGLALSRATPPLLDACVRMLRLLDEPGDAAVLAPLAEREILYRLLTGEQGAMVRHIAASESRLKQISRAIAWIKANFTNPLSIDELATHAGMSHSSFHQHFKAVTRMSPLQYRTQMRLAEARRLMVAEAIDAAEAGFRVGYESPSQFSRDYSRVFGAPPLRDATRLRAEPGYALVA
jgi:AraC-like DNA-binding protein